METLTGHGDVCALGPRADGCPFQMHRGPKEQSMKRLFLFSLRPFASVLAALCVLTLVAAPAQAARRAHVSRGTAHFTGPNDFVGAGIATHLGLYDEEGHVVFSATDDPSVLHLEASAIYTAANGDHLYAEFTGELNGLTGAINATVTYVGG